MDFQINIKRLIMAVRDNACLYDPTCPGYNNKTEKRGAWEAVSAAVVTDWDKMTAKDRYKCGQKVLKRWRSLRDTFLKSEKADRKTVNINGTVYKKKYLYADELKFLLKTYRKRKVSDSSYQEVQAIDTESKDITYEESVEDISDTSNLEHNTASQKSSFPLVSLNRQEARGEPDPSIGIKLEKKSSHITYSSEENVQKPMEDDHDKMFLLSLVPFFRGIQDDDKVLAQIEILQTLRKFRCNGKPKPPSPGVSSHPPQENQLVHNTDPKQLTSQDMEIVKMFEAETIINHQNIPIINIPENSNITNTYS